MTIKKKRILPGVKKKLSGFLTDESGKITKKDALGLGAGASLVFAGTMGETAGHYAHGSHGNHGNGTAGHMSQGHGSGYARNGHLSGTQTAAANQASVNGHWSGTPSGGHQSGYIRVGHVSQAAVSGTRHNNSGSHSSHSNY